MEEWKIVLYITLGPKEIIVYSIITVYTFCKPLHIRILRNGNIPKPSCWPQDNHKCLVIFVLLIWHGWMVEKARCTKTACRSYIHWEEKRGGDGLILFPKEYNNVLHGKYSFPLCGFRERPGVRREKHIVSHNP